MVIGIDIDDTLSETTPKLLEKALEYDKNYLRGKGIIDNGKITNIEYKFDWNENEVNAFRKYMFSIIANEVDIKEGASEILKRLKKENNTIIIITSRGQRDYNNPYEISKKWLDENNISYDKIYVGIDNKAEVCKKEGVELFIDDNISNCINSVMNKIPTLLMNSDLNEGCYDNLTRVYNWNEAYNIINKMKK